MQSGQVAERQDAEGRTAIQPSPALPENEVRLEERVTQKPT
jgi:hypothetical protein